MKKPDHPDYARLIAVLDAMDAGGNERDAHDPYFLKVLQSTVDERAIIALAEQRVSSALEHNKDQIAQDPFLFMVSLYVDAFVLGARFQQAGGHSD